MTGPGQDQLKHHNRDLPDAVHAAAVARGGFMCIPAPMLAMVWLLVQIYPATASGTLPPIPITAGPFRNFAACLNYLEVTHRQQAAMAMAKPAARPHGGTGQTLLSTKGVVRGPGEQATYEAEIGHSNRFIDPKTHQTVSNYDWQRYALHCHGVVFSGTQQNGYDLSGIE